MIGCIHIPSNVNSIINILNASCPNRESPIAIDVLHLIKLSKRATPLFITHQKHKKTLSNNLTLGTLSDNWGVVSMNVFTVVSPPNLMYDDICNLAPDKLTSFMLLPFHRRWYINRSIESEDQAIGSLNCSILERAPCSIGILVEGRRHLKCSNSRDTSSSESSSYSISVVFLGGKDDREAVVLGKRISQDQRVSLTVIHLKATNRLGAILADSDRMLDDEMLRGVKESGYISLKEWSEFQEIGIIGDLLSSADFGGNYSVLIVQQQLRTTYVRT
ncbi:hypothetical protein QQP08_026194 [Theobroma cacao]|nr:hypothetical protein QQP08_026194 [Theobroma cacao]